jgi:hypothetical protein
MKRRTPQSSKPIRVVGVYVGLNGSGTAEAELEAFATINEARQYALAVAQVDTVCSAFKEIRLQTLDGRVLSTFHPFDAPSLQTVSRESIH